MFVIASGQRNLALNKPAYQSSDYGSTALAGKAVDGNADSNWASGSCTHTKKEQGAWWAVDLQAEVTVNSVKVTNRGDCCGESDQRITAPP